MGPNCVGYSPHTSQEKEGLATWLPEHTEKLSKFLAPLYFSKNPTNPTNQA